MTQEHQWRIESLSKRLVQAAKEVRPCLQAGKQPCSDKEFVNAANAIAAKCSPGQTECPDAISKAIKGIENAPKDNNTLTAWLGMIKATGGDGPRALLKTAAKLEFAHAAVYGMVQAAEAMDVLIDDLVRGLGAFAPVARPVLREIASHLLAFVAKEFVEHLENEGYRIAALAERACDAVEGPADRSPSARSVLRKVILRFDGQEFDKTVGVVSGCKEASGGKALNVCETAYKELMGGARDGGTELVPRPPRAEDGDEGRDRVYRQTLVDPLLSQHARPQNQPDHEAESARFVGFPTRPDETWQEDPSGGGGQPSNVATASSATATASSGASSIDASTGPASICSTLAEGSRSKWLCGRVNDLQGKLTTPSSDETRDSNFVALGPLALACLRETSFGASECSADRLSISVGYYRQFILDLTNHGDQESLSAKALAEGVARIEAKLEAIEDRTRRDTEDLRTLMEGHFHELLECRSAQEHRDVLMAALGYRPLLPCTVPQKAKFTSSLFSGVLGDIPNADDVCDQPTISLRASVEFDDREFANPRGEGRSNLEKLGKELRNLTEFLEGSAGQEVHVQGTATDKPVGPACVQMSKEWPNQHDEWHCADAKWLSQNNKDRTLNRRLAFLRARRVCQILNLPGHCVPTEDDSRNKREAILVFKSKKLELHPGCIARK